MFDGKMKAITLSYDDGITQDQRMISILNRYQLKCTFNLNSQLLGTPGSLIRSEKTISHVKPRACEVTGIYRGHEVAAHTLHHPTLKNLSDEEVVREIEEDRLALSQLVGYEVQGMAYPGGDACLDDRTFRLTREKTGILYARRTTCNHSFDLQDDLINFYPTAYHMEGWDTLYALADRFFAAKPDKPQLFYLWGHSYEFDFTDTWGEFERFCQYISGHDDVFYGTNAQCLLDRDLTVK